MTTLIWKDFRHNLPVIVAALILPVLPLAFILASFAFVGEFDGERAGPLELGLPAGFFLAVMSVWLLGCCIISSERDDRSCEFLASIPVSRWKVVASKLTLVAAIFLVIYGTLGLISLMAVERPMEGRNSASLFALLALYLPNGIFAAGIGWFLSTLIRPVLINTFASLILYVLVFAVGDFFLGVSIADDRILIEQVLAAIAIAGLVLFAVGAVIFGRKLTP